jgi:uncharacterized protein (DUF952 family)/diadenosine tetraphosphate (Ap4A) HIT family hydrolase
MGFTLDQRLADSSHLVSHVDDIQVRLADDARYMWLMLVPEVAGGIELHDLGTADQQRLMTLAARLGAWLKEDTGADKVNTAAIGNIVPQLHLHIVARHDSDAAWPAPIWGHGEPEPMDKSLRKMRIEKLAGFLASQAPTNAPVYKICDAELWHEAEAAGRFTGAEIDIKDGYIHFSSLFQVRKTAKKHFSGQDKLLIIEVNQEKLNIVWEVSRGGDLFPHLYETLPLTAVISVKPMSLSRSGEPEPIGGWRAYLERFINPQ